ncbi:MAG: MarR family transcriptional regulator [Pseudolysinimonas sp.]
MSTDRSVEAAPPEPGGVRQATYLMREVLTLSRAFQVVMRGQLGVNATDLDAMELLITNGPMGPTELAQSLAVSTAAATTVVDRLVAAGHARRTQHPTDRRSVLVVPNPDSVAIAMGSIMPMVMGIDGALDSFTDEEQAAITRYLELVVASYRGTMPAADDTESGPAPQG